MAAPGPKLIHGSRRGLTAQKAFAAKYRTALRGSERYGGFPAALGATGYGFRFAETVGRTLALRFTAFAPFWFVSKVLVVEEVLFSRCEDKL